MKRVVILCGRAGHGKDTLAELMMAESQRLFPQAAYQLYHPVEYLRDEFATILRTAGHPEPFIRAVMHGELKEEPLQCLHGSNYRNWMGARIRNTPPVRASRRYIDLIRQMGPNVIITGGRWRSFLNLWRHGLQAQGWQVVLVWIERPGVPLVEEERKFPSMHNGRGWYDVRIANSSNPAAMLAKLKAHRPDLFR